ncbi:hypothetical protein GGI42DRAFT_139799 [Trichoderma sp. SZMC 28013]
MGKALFLPCLCPAMLVIDLAAFNCDVEGRTAHPRLVCNGTSPALFLCEYLKFTKSYPKSQHDLVSTLKVAGCRNCPGPVPFPQGREKNKDIRHALSAISEKQKNFPVGNTVRARFDRQSSGNPETLNEFFFFFFFFLLLIYASDGIWQWLAISQQGSSNV